MLLADLRWRLNKPYYLFRPTQAVRRLVPVVRNQPRSDGLALVTLPWGAQLLYRPDEQIGRCIDRRGVFDLAVCEALHRLAEQGDLTVDVGANIGQMTSVLAMAVGPSGRVLAFEPLPEILAVLAENVRSWSRRPAYGEVEVHPVALSSSEGEGTIGLKEAFARNMGSAGVVTTPGAVDETTRLRPVLLRRLDRLVPDESIGVMKIDVEGHEAEVLKGAEELLRDGRVRDVVFEDFEPYPSAATALLERWGYRVFALDQSIFGPVLNPPEGGPARRSMEDPSYLATKAPQRAEHRMRRRGWEVLGRALPLGRSRPFTPAASCE